MFEIFITMKIQVGYLCFRGPCCLHLQSEVIGDGKKKTASILGWSARGQQMPLANRRWEWEGNCPVPSATSVRREC